LTYFQFANILEIYFQTGEAKVETTATSKGQIVIPSSLRKKLGIKEGTRIQIEFDEDAGEIILKPITREFVHSLRGKFKGKGLLKALMAEKKREREL
jgi:AbrB family looped-hinge helix DNA binding protein